MTRYAALRDLTLSAQVLRMSDCLLARDKQENKPNNLSVKGFTRCKSTGDDIG